jgi:hypothetical protein
MDRSTELREAMIQNPSGAERNRKDHAMTGREDSGLRSSWIAALILVTAYASLRLGLNTQYENATWQQLYDLSAPMPFGHRVLVPLLSRPLVELLDLAVPHAFLIFEALSSALLLWCLRGALRTRVDVRFADLWAAGAFLWLCYPFLLRHRWPIFYPYDTASMAFTAGFLWALLRRRYLTAVAITAVAALNRETTLYFPMLAGIVLLGELPFARLAGLAAGVLAAHVLVRAGVAHLLPGNAGEAMQFFVGGVPRVSNNAAWLITPPNVLVLIASMGFLPVFWFALSRWMPADLRRLRLPAAAMFLSLTLVGNLYEPRILGELLVVIYIPVAVAATAWLVRTPGPQAGASCNVALTAWIDRWGLAAVVIPWAAATLALRFLLDWPAPPV